MMFEISNCTKVSEVMFRTAKFFVYCILITFSVVFMFYLLLPTPGLPPAPSDSVRSPQPADNAFPLRPAYFTNLDRQQIINYYDSSFSRSPLLDIYLFTYRLNYPPEESSLLVRPHIQSSYLEEIVHPFRESIFINGFYPTRPQDEIWHDGKHFKGKVTIKYIPSPLLPRVTLGILTLAILFMVVRELIQQIKRR